MVYPLCSKYTFTSFIIGLIYFLNISSDSSRDTIFLKSHSIVIFPLYSNSHNNELILLSFTDELIRTTTDFVLPIFRISFKISGFERNGIFLPSFAVLFAYNLKIFSCLDAGLNLIRGFISVA